MKQIQIIGNIGQDATIHESNGSKFTRFSVAVSKKYKDINGVEHNVTDWFTCFKNPSKTDEFLLKGTQVFLQGDLDVKCEKYESNYLVKCTIKVQKLQLLNSKTQ
jgi:single-stranded DNA-binding protein